MEKEAVTNVKTIRRTYHGGSEEINFDHFWEFVIQDYTVGLETARDMLEGDGTATANDDQPEFYEEYEVLDQDVLAEQIRLAEIETEAELSS
jgi:hypothetical protein